MQAMMNGDGVPDAIDFAIPASMVGTVLAEEGSIQVALYGVNLPLPLMADGAVATVNLSVAPDAQPGRPSCRSSA